MKQIAKAIIAKTPYRVVRDRGANRFQAIEVSLRGLKERGFCPNVIIDGGAHLGTFSLNVKKIFPNAVFHLVEPQSACFAALEQTCGKEGFTLHKCALSDHDGKLSFTNTTSPNTGAQVSTDEASYLVSACTLDTLLAHQIAQEDKTLLKLDLQGYELHALRGATSL